MSIPSRTMRRSTQDNASVQRRTMCRYQTGQCDVSKHVRFFFMCMSKHLPGAVPKQDSVSFLKRVMCCFHKGQCIASAQDSVPFPTRIISFLKEDKFPLQANVSFPNGTMGRFRTGHSAVAETTTPKRFCRNSSAETSTPKRPRRKFAAEAPKRPRRNENNIQIFRNIKFRWPNGR